MILVPNFWDLVLNAQVGASRLYNDKMLFSLLANNSMISKAFLDELGAASFIEKKPLLRMTCSKVRFNI